MIRAAPLSSLSVDSRSWCSKITGRRVIPNTRWYHRALASTSRTVGEKWWTPVTPGPLSVLIDPPVRPVTLANDERPSRGAGGPDAMATVPILQSFERVQKPLDVGQRFLYPRMLNTFKSRSEAPMDLTVMTYLLYLAVTAPLTMWVGRALARHGEVFLVDVFHGDLRLAHAVNQLLVIGFYLLNFGYLSYFMASSAEVRSGRALTEVVSAKAGGVALVIGVVHVGNLWCLNAFRRRALLRAQGMPPAAPNHYTAVVPPAAPGR